MSSPYWNSQDPRPSAYPTPGGWGSGDPTAPPPAPGWGRPVPIMPPPGFPAPPTAPEPAGFGRRLAARTIDYVLVVIAAIAFFVLMAMVVMILNPESETTNAQGALWALLFFFGWGVLLFFYDWLYLVTWGRTLGKMMVGIRVVSDDGGRLRQGQAMGRAACFGLPQSLPVVGHLFTLGESMAALGDSRCALHDRFAGTKVVRA